MEASTSSFDSASYRMASRPNVVQAPTVIAMVGLPARGKTYISMKLTHYLNWIGINTKAFNVGQYRRAATESYKNHNFFSQDNKDAMAIRRECAVMALKDASNYLLNEGGQVAVVDATNTTRERRNLIIDICTFQNPFKLFFIESVCDDANIVRANILEVKVCSPDYTDMNKSEALDDFMHRIEHYQNNYEQLDIKHDSNISFIQIFNQGERFLVNKLAGHLQSRVVYYLMNIHVLPRTIYLTRHGETEMNVAGRIGGNGNLSERGWLYAEELAKYIKDENIPDLKVWTSQLKRTIQTATHIDAPKEHWKALNEIDAGICEGMTYEEIHLKYPHEFERRTRDKYHYRYPNGESYQDLVNRLEPVIMELERQENVLLICHQAVLRCLLAYFEDKNSLDITDVPVPFEHVVKLTLTGCGLKEEHISLLSGTPTTAGPSALCRKTYTKSIWL